MATGSCRMQFLVGVVQLGAPESIEVLATKWSPMISQVPMACRILILVACSLAAHSQPISVVATLAGSLCAGYSDGDRKDAQFSNPSDIAVNEDVILIVSHRGSARWSCGVGVGVGVGDMEESHRFANVTFKFLRWPAPATPPPLLRVLVRIKIG